jgi:hypothetical protein
MVDWTTVWNYVQEWIILIGCAVVIIAYALWRKYRKKKPQQVVGAKALTPERPVENKPQKEPEPEVAPRKDPFETFSTVQKKEEKKDVLLSIQQLNHAMISNTNEMDKHMRAEFERLRRQLESVHARKEYIRKYGIELSRLYDKHQQSEAYLTHMLQGMQALHKKEEGPKRIQ